MTQFQSIFFDIDGTLIDSNEQHVTSWALAFRDAGHPQEADAIRRQIGKGGDLLVPTLIPDANEALVKSISKDHGDIFAKAYLSTVKPFARAADLVRKVQASGLKVVLASSAKRAEIDFYVKLLDIEKCLSATTSIDDVGTSKPEPDIFSSALTKVGVPADRAIVVGDTIYDVEGAGRAGIVTIGVASGPFSADEMRDAGAIKVFADVAALFKFLDGSSLNTLA